MMWLLFAVTQVEAASITVWLLSRRSPTRRRRGVRSPHEVV